MKKGYRVITYTNILKFCFHIIFIYSSKQKLCEMVGFFCFSHEWKPFFQSTFSLSAAFRVRHGKVVNVEESGVKEL